MSEAWTTEHADEVFSRMIRKRDRVCKRCRWRPSTDCSHFFLRHHSATRYDPRNADGVCRECHNAWEGGNNGYREFKIQQIGRKAFRDMDRLHRQIVKREEAIAAFKKQQI